MVCISDDPTVFRLAQVRRLIGTSCPDYTALLHDGSALAVACERQFKFEFDSINPVIAEDPVSKSATGICN